ncbi:hypothetical protein LEP1GSC016_1351 [Leptospira borgpetersenii serovar Hardjo-bovis str. Sponselee]|uniref:Uncharacterized protein n=1 Tax=Leptospira borgpetersenii serovar Hardjo-bovis str. Sponselee TaxID=1303729 RepID=M6BZB1_LEPBO|nr:hypothetical protein LEP1GSC016_1351 [Leptospira borgpetersenii serovar Hardjo-bovis str. Sponselee]
MRISQLLIRRTWYTEWELVDEFVDQTGAREVSIPPVI